MEWIDLAQDRDRWRAVVNAAMNFGGPTKCGEFFDWVKNLLASQEITLLHGISMRKIRGRRFPQKSTESRRSKTRL